jgi:translation elongation factor EF-Tu-like GTPase
MFEMIIDGVYCISGRGIVVTGHPNRESIRVGESVEIWNPDGSALDTVITGVEMVSPRRPNDNIGLLLRTTETLKTKDNIHPGAVMRRK